MTLSANNLMRQAWLMVGLLWSVAFLNDLERMSLKTTRSSIKVAIPMTDASFGPLKRIFLLAHGLLSPLGRFTADKFTPSRIITLKHRTLFKA